MNGQTPDVETPVDSTMHALEIREHAIAIIGEDRVPVDVLEQLVADFGGGS